MHHAIRLFLGQYSRVVHGNTECGRQGISLIQIYYCFSKVVSVIISQLCPTRGPHAAQPKVL